MAHTVPSDVVRFVDQAIPKAKQQQLEGLQAFASGSDEANQLAALVELVDNVPSELLRLDSSSFAELRAAVAAIRMQLTIWQVQKHSGIMSCGYGTLHPATLIRRALALCPDTAIPNATPGLTFVRDDELRESLREDLAVAERAFTEAEWKAATVLAGSVIEALLLDALAAVMGDDQGGFGAAVESVNARQQGAKGWRPCRPDKLDEWSVRQYAEAAHELQIIRDRTHIECLQTKDFRNLIHPGRALRLAMKCSRGTAHAALAAVEFVIEDLLEQSGS